MMILVCENGDKRIINMNNNVSGTLSVFEADQRKESRAEKRTSR